MTKILKWFVCLLCWLLIPPLFYYLSKKWGLIGKKMRILLFLIAPWSLIAYCVIIFLTVEYGYVRHRNHARIYVEKMTEVQMPRFRFINYRYGRIHWTGDFTDHITIKFWKTPSDEFYNTLDSLSAVKYSGWSKSQRIKTNSNLDSLYWNDLYGTRDTAIVYKYSTIWSYGRIVKQGHFSMEIIKDEKKAYIDHGRW